ncbi:MAG: hypothetical protein IT261_11880 [Saprospiraceae bacterium]|nr:hypothetical protein [Saprospiraceae bacterium]
MATWFYLERMTNLDMAFQTFLMLKSGHPEIQSGRFGAVVTQIWASMAQWLGAPLKGVLMAYSFGHAIWPVLLAGLSWYWGQWRWALAILSVATLMTTHTFFWLSEMPQGLALICAVYAWMHHKKDLKAFSWLNWLFWLSLLWTAFYLHPMVLYANLFIGIYFLLEPGKKRDWKAMHLVPIVVFVALAILKYKVLKLDWYDAAALKRQEAFGRLWPDWLDIDSNRQFLEWCSNDYQLVWLVIFGAIAWGTWQRQYLRAAWIAVCAVGYVLLVNVPFYDSIGKQFYMENLYLPLAVFASIPLVFGVLGKPENQLSRANFWGLAILFLLSFTRIINAGKEWSLRMNWEKQTLQQTAVLPSRKIIMTEQEAPMDLLKMSWGSPYEFLLLSALQHPDSARCLIITDQPGKYDSLMNAPRLFLGTFRNYSLDSLPQRYFRVEDTSGYVKTQSGKH